MPALPRRAAVAALTIAAALMLAACGDGSPQATGTTTTTTGPGATSGPSTTAADTTPTIEVTVVGGKPQGGVRREQVKTGETLVLRVTADVADEVHLHGYDKSADVAPGKPAEIRFTADIPGVFEVELEQHKQKLIELEVR
jgi:ABC-type glycerol-3-phosphate transport system substrate-binding protein